MYFPNAMQARIYANLQTRQTGYKHKVMPCKKHLCPPKEYFGRDYINGFTVILITKKR